MENAEQLALYKRLVRDIVSDIAIQGEMPPGTFFYDGIHYDLTKVALVDKELADQLERTRQSANALVAFCANRKA